MTGQSLHYWQRQVAALGSVAQKKISQTRILIIGMGGLGHPIATYLMGAGVGGLTLVDDDVVAESNLHRQWLFRREHVGLYKVDIAAEQLRSMQTHTEIHSIQARVGLHNAQKLMDEYSIMIDATDGLPVKFMIHDQCVLHQKTLIHGAATAMAGQVCVVRTSSPCLRCLFEMPPPGLVPSCQEAGIVGPVVGVVGAMMAIATLNVICENEPSHQSMERSNRFHSFDGQTLQWRSMTFRHNEECIACGREPTISQWRNHHYEQGFFE